MILILFIMLCMIANTFIFIYYREKYITDTAESLNALTPLIITITTIPIPGMCFIAIYIFKNNINKLRKEYDIKHKVVEFEYYLRNNKTCQNEYLYDLYKYILENTNDKTLFDTIVNNISEGYSLCNKSQSYNMNYFNENYLPTFVDIMKHMKEKIDSDKEMNEKLHEPEIESIKNYLNRIEIKLRGEDE